MFASINATAHAEGCPKEEQLLSDLGKLEGQFFKNHGELAISQPELKFYRTCLEKAQDNTQNPGLIYRVNGFINELAKTSES